MEQTTEKRSPRKVLTLTTSYANNYGALIQCYALSRFVSLQPNTICHVIQYNRPNAARSWTLLKKPHTLRDFLKIIYTLFNISYVISFYKKRKLMREFIRHYIPFTIDCWNSPEEIRENPPEADVYICGSDQIWNMKYMFHGKTIYFLDFVKKGKKISYAASIADPWTEEQVNTLTPLIKSFDAVSIREYGNLAQVKRIFPKATVVIDPVFLLDQTEWSLFAKTSLCPKEPYILCYFLSVSPLAVSTVKRVRELTGYKVVHLNLNALDKFHSDYNIRVADPRDFVGLISNATVICTNSFHCSAFSVIFEKNFVFVPKNMANERVVNLQDKFKLGNICISGETLSKLEKKDLMIDYSQGRQQGQDFINCSKQFLVDGFSTR